MAGKHNDAKARQEQLLVEFVPVMALDHVFQGLMGHLFCRPRLMGPRTVLFTHEYVNRADNAV